MSVLFIKIGNEIIQREQICSANFGEFSPEDAKLLGADRILYIKTTDGETLRFKNNEARQLWACLEATALDITPLEE